METNTIYCTACGKPCPPGASFCPHCGQAIQSWSLTGEGAAENQSSEPSATSPSTATAQTTQFQTQPGTTSQPKPVEQQSDPMSSVSLIFGILSLPAAILPIVGIPFGLIALTLGLRCRPQYVPGVVLGIVGLVLSVLVFGYVYATMEILESMLNSPRYPRY